MSTKVWPPRDSTCGQREVVPDGNSVISVTYAKRQLGQRSYEVYLTHMFVVFALFGIFLRCGHPAWAVLPLFLLTTLVAAIAGDLVARYFSEPVNWASRQRWSKGPRQLGSVSDS
jgi:peptidoglycan/LPS O-acetylase OafA/YrhL